MELNEERQKDLERRFFMFGFILIDALKKISDPQLMIKNHEAPLGRLATIQDLENIASSALETFNHKLGTTDFIYTDRHKESLEPVPRKENVYCSDCRWYLTRRQKYSFSYIKKKLDFFEKQLNTNPRLYGSPGLKYSYKLDVKKKGLLNSQTECSECSYPDNVCKWLEDSFAEPNFFYRSPKEINSDNNCKWFESK